MTARATPPPPWAQTGWHDNRTVEWTLHLPGASWVKVGRESPKHPWFWRNEHGPRTYDPAAIHRAPVYIGPFGTANAAAIDAEKHLAVAMRQGMRALRKMRAA